MCDDINPIETNTRFILLMHPKEFRKTKNGTGHFTHLSLPNSELFVGIDFTKNDQIQSIINDPKNACFVLYPSSKSINLNENTIASQNKNIIIFLIDATWPCSRAILSASPDIDQLPKVSFTHEEVSKFTFKEQPKPYCLSTMESTHILLKLLNKHQIENIEETKLKQFLRPFEKMVAYQLSCER
jgi:DTW domain-containing protein YfiP